MSRKTVIAIVGRIVTAIVIAALMGGAWWLWQRLLTGPAVNWGDPYVAAVLVGSIAALMGGAWWLWWWLPKRQVARLALKIRDPKARADTEDNFRKTVGQALGGAAVLIGAGAAYLQFTQQQQAARDLLISNQVSKSFEQLGSTETATRLGGIYGLEGVMSSSEQYHQPVLEALCAFVRERTIGKTVGREPTTDIQAALTVIGRQGRFSRVNLAKVSIPGANLNGAHLNGADLHGADLRGLDLRDPNPIILSTAFTELRFANLTGANLDGAFLVNANLRDIFLTRANLTGAHLDGADLISAVLAGAHLDHATLWNAHLEGANLDDADLSNTDLRDAYNLTQAQLDNACGTGVQLPPGLTLKPCPAPAPSAPARP